jgi:hypothetical protein
VSSAVSVLIPSDEKKSEKKESAKKSETPESDAVDSVEDIESGRKKVPSIYDTSSDDAPITSDATSGLSGKSISTVRRKVGQKFSKKECGAGFGEDKYTKKELLDILDKLQVGYSRYETKTVLCKRVQMALGRSISDKPIERKVAINKGVRITKKQAPKAIDWSRCKPGNASNSYKTWELKALLKKLKVQYFVNDNKSKLCQRLLRARGKEVPDSLKQIGLKPYEGADEEIVGKINKEVRGKHWKHCGKGFGRDVWTRKELERWLRSLRIRWRVNDNKDILCKKLRDRGVKL